MYKDYDFIKDIKMEKKTNRKNILFMSLVWVLEGILVGFGAILPGISGGTLCVAFGMYRPIIEVLSDFKAGFKKNWFMIGVFIVGVAVGFVGLSGLAAWLLEKNTTLVTCAFVGFIMGTFPELWRDAGEQKRTKGSIVSLAVSFIIMIGILALLKTQISVQIAPGFLGFLLCGVFWGFSFIIPGLSSSSLLLFFGLYQPMLDGIATINFRVLIPMAIGMGACVLLLSKAVGFAYKKQYSLVSHAVLGIVAATAIMILPFEKASVGAWAVRILFVIGGAALSYMFTCICNKLKAKYDTKKD